MPYLLAMRNIPRLAFISNQTRCEFDTKIARKSSRETFVFPLGGDGLRLEKQSFSQERRSFVYFGTIESRKNVGAVLRAFMALWERGVSVELFVIGRMDSRAQDEAALINQLQNEHRFDYLGHASDAAIRDALRKARATIFVSSEEGFGIPAIVSNALPSINDLPKGGCLKIETVSPGAICTAIEFIANDANAIKLWQEASDLPIPTWRDFAAGLSNWLHSF